MTTTKLESINCRDNHNIALLRVANEKKNNLIIQNLVKTFNFFLCNFSAFCYRFLGEFEIN